MEQVYRSPIALCCNEAINVCQKIKVTGCNHGAKYNGTVFEVQDVIIITLGSRRYQVDEYHFHMPGEHEFCGKIYAAEFHYTLVELHNNEKYLPDNYKVDGIIPADRNIMGLARPIKKGGKPTDLEKLQVPLPCNFYEYDSTRHIPNFNPVRWVVGPKPLKFDINQVAEKALPARPLQPVNNRIILYDCGQ